MPQGNPKPGERYLHFKQKMYQVITTARHSETGELLVIYQALYGDFQVYARPLEQFVSLADREKYPDVRQKYRFQLQEEVPENTSGDRAKVPEKSGRESTAETPGKSAWGNAAETPGKSGYGDTAEEKLMAFFDARTMEQKYEILLDMREDITDRMINNMAVVLDVVIEEGPPDQRYEELKTCVRTFQKYEVER